MINDLYLLLNLKAGTLAVRFDPHWIDGFLFIFPNVN